jgi:hypothetical protein
MEYVIQREESAAAARFGELRLPSSSYRLPGGGAGLRTRTDVEAVMENARHGTVPEVLVPFASRGKVLGPALLPLVRRVASMTAPVVHPPLVIADCESEAFSVPSVAQLNYRASSPAPGDAVSRLLSTGLTSDTSAHRQEVHSAWRQVQRLFGLAPVVDFVARQQSTVQSDVLSVPTPIIRSSPQSVNDALSMGAAMLPYARAFGAFSMFGMSLVIHAEVLDSTTDAEASRAELVRASRGFAATPALNGIVLALKVYDPQRSLTDQSRGSPRRASLSELVTALQRGLAAAGGLLVCLDAHNWVLGYLDSGADVASFKVTGRPGIEYPSSRGAPPGPRRPPDLLLARELVEVPESNVKTRYAAPPGGAFPVPACLQPERYWLRSWSEKNLYTARARAGVLVELGEHYRAAGLDAGTPLAEAVRSAVRDSRVPELADLCPSIW